MTGLLAERAPPAPSAAVLIGFAAMVVGNFMAILDVQIVASALGALQAGVSASRDEISWVQTAYLIAEVIGIPLSGFLGRALGVRLLFSLSALAFSLTSLLCAFAWDVHSLIVFRALQGFAGAAMIPTTMATMYSILPQRMQPMGAALVGMFMMLGPTLGPSIGGYIAEALGWRALFWVNLVPGIAVAAIVWSSMDGLPRGAPALLQRIDFSGLIGLAAFLGAAEYVLEEGPANDWFASAEIVWWACVSIAGACLFFWRAFTATTPIVDLQPFRTPIFAIGAMLGFVLGFSLFATVFLTPLFLASVRGYSPLQIGETMFLQGAVMLVAAPILGAFGRQLDDTRLYGAAGFLFVAAGSLLQSHLTAEAGFVALAWPQVLRGAGLVMTFSAVMQPSLSALPPPLLHAGAGLFNTVRNLGGAFGIAALATLQAHAYALHRQELYAAADPTNPHVQGMIAQSAAYLAQAGARDPERQALMHYASMLDREALVMTFNDQFALLALVIAASALLMVALRPARRAAAAELALVH